MPLPLGHTAIGLAIYEAGSSNSAFHRWGVFLFVVFLANLPDLDVLAGLIANGNGSTFHHGFSHSLIFASFMGFLASNAWRLWSRIPRLGFTSCSLVILSHVLADYFLSDSPVSIFWPFQVGWSSGDHGWRNVLEVIFFQEARDIGILVGGIAAIVLIRLIKARLKE
jgi:membrane-bound metal-dependent hydrolase YbcI (DUF457 family)